MEDFENDAQRAYSKIQSLLNFPSTYSSSNDLLDTPGPASKSQFTSPSPGFSGPIGTPSNYAEMAPYTNELVTLNINEEGFERKIHPDEQMFHELLQLTMQQQDDGDFSFVCGVPAANSTMQAEIAGRYANAAQERFVERAQEARRYGAGIEFSPNVRGLGTQQPGNRRAQQLERGVQEQRAERDLWSLLETLTAANLLYDIDESNCEEAVQKVLAGLPITASIPDYLQAAFSVDDRLRKGAVLKEWIEKSSMDLVTEAPAPRGEPWSETLNRVLHSRHGNPRRTPATAAGSIQSLHPDGQIDPEGCLLALDGVDRLDQENLLKSIWQLVRCGLVQRAQQLAEEHRLYWLSASLQGIATHFYKPVALSGDPDQLEPSEEIVGVSRIGNLRQPIWLRTCWLYATKLSSSRDSKNTQISAASGHYEIRGSSSSIMRGMLKEDSLVGLLECGIYAALCNHTKVLAASPLVPAWQDRVWVYLKAAHERDIARITHQYRRDKAARSKHFAGCDTATLSAERELFDLAKTEVGHLSAASCVQIFNKVPPPSGGRTAEAFLLSLQAAVMEGRAGIEHYIATTLKEFLRSTESFPGKEQVLRVFCHFCIWLKYAHTDNAALSDLLSLETMYLAVERYIDLLIEDKQRSLVAAYAAYLSRPRRIHKYAQLLRTMQSSAATVGADAAEVLQLANTFFPSDVMDITRTVVEDAHAPSVAVTAPASVQKRTAQSRAPPLASLSSPINMGQAFSHTPASRSVRFAFAEGEEPLEGDVAAAADTPFVAHSTPTKFSVRGRTATPRRPVGAPRTPGSAGSMGGSELLPGTPGVGSELMMICDSYTTDEDRTSKNREQSVYTRLRAAASDSTSSTATLSADMQQLESLRWLFFDASHRFEAVKQANRFAVSFLLHKDGMKLAQLRALLSDFVPLDSIAVGVALIEQRRQAVRDVELQYLHDHEASSVQQLPSAEREHVQALQSELSIEEGLWDAQVCKLQLWQDFTAATQDVDMFHRAVLDFQADSCRQLSLPSAALGTQQGASGLARHGSKIARTASTAADSILCAITCSADSQSPNPADGFKDIWAQNESAAIVYITRTAGLLLHRLQELLCKEDSDDLDAPSARLSEAEWKSIGAAVAALWLVAREVYGGEAQSEHPVFLAVQTLVKLGLPASHSTDDEHEGGAANLEDSFSVSSAALSDMALSIVTALSQCRLYLADVREGKLLAGALLYQLLSTHLQVCMGAASVLASLGQDRDAAGWYGRAMQLADLVASEDHSLQLYTLLHREDLEALLRGINTAAMALLRLDPDMHIGAQQG